jgi:hypothetical protein
MTFETWLATEGAARIDASVLERKRGDRLGMA